MSNARWKEVKLTSGRKVKIKELSVDDMDICKDTARVVFDKDELKSITGVNKARTTWIRKGTYGGDFKTWKGADGTQIPDSAIKELTATEADDLMIKVQEAQSLGEFKATSIS